MLPGKDSFIYTDALRCKTGGMHRRIFVIVIWQSCMRYFGKHNNHAFPVNVLMKRDESSFARFIFSFVNHWKSIARL